MRIGIYGGTFDPPHNGHIAAAKAAMERLSLDKLLLIPTFIPPHKALPAGAASPRQRYDMAVLATAALGKKAEVLDMELERGGPSYTWETLRLLRSRYRNRSCIPVCGPAPEQPGDERHPGSHRNVPADKHRP